MEAFRLTKSKETTELEKCAKCGSVQWTLDRSHYDLHGHGIRCANCSAFLKWTGRGKEKAKNPKFAAKHKAQNNGERICDFCGRTESETKLTGGHFATDHRLAENFGGDDCFENTRPLCSRCHYLKTALEHDTRGLRKLMERLTDGN